MPRANRHAIPGQVWHITQRCHQRAFLLKFAEDRDRWRRWMLEARRRFEVCVLDYIVTSNHVHIVLRDRGRGEIARAMQLASGRTAQEFNHRKKRHGAFWEDRYHATAIDTETHLSRCVTYVDLNMIRAGAVAHPADWSHSGFAEIQGIRKRNRLIDLKALCETLGLPNEVELRRTHAAWIGHALERRFVDREAEWTEAIAVGRESFVRSVQSRLGIRARYRTITPIRTGHMLGEPASDYGG